MKYMPLFSAGFVLINLMLSTSVYAQQLGNDVEKTPRDVIIGDLGLDGAPKIIDVDLPLQTIVSPPKISKKPPVDIDAVIAPKTPQETPQEAVVDVEIETPIEPAADSKVSAAKAIKSKKSTVKPTVKSAPFYLSAKQYLTLRGEGAHPQIILDYDVQNGPVLDKTFGGLGLKSSLGDAKKIKLILGSDYAALENGSDFKIYDFRFNRILTVKPEFGPEFDQDGKPTSGQFFDNTSLYAKAYRDMTAVRSATRNGRLKKIAMGAGQSFDAFWIESAMSWSANEADMTMKVEGLENGLVVKRKGEIVFSAEFSDKTYGADVGKDSLFAFAHHAWPLHPNVLRALYAYDAPPKQFEMTFYGPMTPKGQRQIWTLVKRTDENARFPLPKHAIGVAQRTKTSPLVFLINEAVYNRALGGMESVDSLASKFTDKMDTGKFGQAWEIGQKYIAYTGGCSSTEKNICDAVADIAQNKKEDVSERTQNYMEIIDAANRPGLKAEAIEAAKPYLDDVETPAFILRITAMARAKMKPAQARAAGLSSLSAETLLKTALAKDPYDPNTYIGLAQVLAAKGAFEQSWDINDALRAGIPAADNIDLKIDRLEEKLEKSAPGYFLSK